MDKFVYDKLQEIIARNAELHRPSEFYTWMHNMYVGGIAIAIRRQVDERRDTISFVRFLRRLQKNPAIVSLEHYRSLWDPADPAHAQLRGLGLFERVRDKGYAHFVGRGKEQPTKAEFEKEIRELQDLSGRVVDFASSMVAHTGQERPDELPTFGEVNKVIDHLDALLRKYVLLFRAVDLDTGIYFQYDWTAIFRVPWIKQKFASG